MRQMKQYPAKQPVGSGTDFSPTGARATLAAGGGMGEASAGVEVAGSSEAARRLRELGQRREKERKLEQEEEEERAKGGFTSIYARAVSHNGSNSNIGGSPSDKLEQAESLEVGFVELGQVEVES